MDDAKKNKWFVLSVSRISKRIPSRRVDVYMYAS